MSNNIIIVCRHVDVEGGRRTVGEHLICRWLRIERRIRVLILILLLVLSIGDHVYLNGRTGAKGEREVGQDAERGGWGWGWDL